MESQPKHLSANANRAARRHPKESDATSLMPNPTVSRRTFLSATAVVGALSFLGSLISPKGTVVNAYADEAGNTHFSVYVLGKDEIPVMAMRQTATGNVAVSGVKVTITSLYNQKQVSVTTGADGFAPVHIRDLSFQCEDDDADSYAFYGSVTAQAEGYRDIRYVEEYFESAVPAAQDGSRPNALEIPLEVDDGSSYLLNVSMDDIDILHSTAPAQVGDYNDIQHTVSVEIVRAATSASTDVPVSLIVDDAEWASTTAIQDVDNPKVSKASFTDYYLSKIQAGQKLKLCFQVSGEKAKTVTLPIEFEPAIILEGAFGSGSGSGKLQCAPGIDIAEQVERPGLISMAWFFGESDTFSYGIPGLPIEFFSDVAGNFGFAITALTWQFYKSKDGEKITDTKKLKKYGGKAGMAAMDSWREKTMEYALDNLLDAYGSANDNHGFGASKFSRSLSFSFELTVRGTAKCQYVDKEAKKGEVTGSAFLGANGRFGLDIAFGWQLVLLYLPVYVNVDLSGSFTIRLGLGLNFKDWLLDPQWDTTGISIVVVACVQAGLSVGLGIRGLVGIGVRGYASATGSLNVHKENNPTAIVTGAAEAGLQLFIQSLFFYKSFLICHPAYTDISNREKSVAAALDNMQNLVDPSNLDLSDARPVSQGALLATKEFESAASTTPEVNAAAEAGDEATVGVSHAMPETFTRTRDRILVARHPLVAPGPQSAQGFASPYGALDANGEVLLGASSSFTSDLAAADHQNAFKSVKTYNPRLGLVPVEQEILYDKVFGNSHVRTFVGSSCYSSSPEKNTVMARLVTVSIPDNAGQTWTRTRVHLRPWDAEQGKFGGEQVLNFKVDGLDAKDRYDVDFDIDVREYDGQTILAIAVTSIKVAGNEGIDYNTAADRQFVTFLTWDIANGELLWSKSLYTVLAEQSRSTYHPRALFQGAHATGVDLVCFYYQRKEVGATSDEGIFASAYENLYDDNYTPFTPRGVEDSICICPNDSGSQYAGENYEIACAARADTKNPDYMITARIAVARQSKNGDVAITAVKYGLRCWTEDTLTLNEVASISPLGKQDSPHLFSYTFDSDKPGEKLNHVINYDAATRKLSAVETSGYTTDSNIFASADGKRLYTVRLSEGSNNKLDDDAQAAIDAGAMFSSSVHYVPQTGANFGGAATDSDQREPVYQLLESRWIESLGAFHEFYPIARLSFSPDNSSILTCANGRRDFVMASLTGLPQMEDAADNPEVDVKADIYHVSVPDVVAIQCEGVAVTSPFAAAGDTVTYEVEVSNIGNCLVNGFTVTLRDSDGNVVDEKVCDDLREYLQQSPDNYHPVYEDGEAVVDEDGSVVTEFVEDIRDTSGILWPGFLRKYRFSFTMPEGYEGETSFNVQVSEPRSNPYANALSASEVLLAGSLSMPSHLSWLEPADFAEPVFGASLQSICDPRRMPFTLEQKAVSEAVASSFSAVPAVYQTDDQIDGGGYEPADEPKDETSGKKAAKVKVPQTGDNLHSAKGVAAAALVTAAAAGAIKHHGANREDDAS